MERLFLCVSDCEIVRAAAHTQRTQTARVASYCSSIQAKAATVGAAKGGTIRRAATWP